MSYHKHHTDEGESAKHKGESAASTDLSEDSTSDTPTEATEDSKPIETPRVPTVSIKCTHDDGGSSINKLWTEFEPLKENGEQIIIKDNKLLTINLTVEIQNKKWKGS